jgi:hypothetical protein
MANFDLEQTIEDAVNDSVAPVEPEVETPDSTTDDTTEPTMDEVATDVAAEVAEEHEAELNPDSNPVAPGAKAPTAKDEDDFAKRHGLQSQSVTGRENRIPYSRVKKIVGKVEAEAKKFKTELDTIKPKFTEYETKVRDYESRLEKIGQFEHILENDPKTFLSMLSQVPAYKEFFDYVAQMASGTQGKVEEPAKADPADEMPQPGPDGLYDMEGLKKLLEWNAAQVEKRTIKQVEERYKPIEQAWQSQEQMARIVPVVERQIAEARTWDKFNELEGRVVAILKEDPNSTLEKAYLKAYQEAVQAERAELQPNRDKMRAEILAEIKKTPTKAATAPVGAVRPKQSADATPRSIEDIIANAVQEAGLK